MTCSGRIANVTGAPVFVPFGTGTAVTLAIRPEHVNVTPPTSQSSPTAVGKISTKNYLGDSALLEVDLNGVTLIAKLAGDCELSVGAQAAVELPAHRWHVFS